MTLEQVLAIRNITDEQKAAAQRWYKVPLQIRKNEELQGTQQQILLQLDRMNANHAQLLESKRKKIEKVGSFKEFSEMGKRLVETEKAFTYKQLCEYLEAATEERSEKIREYHEMMRELKTLKDELGL